MPPTLNLPAGLEARPLLLTDAAAVTALIVAEELLDLGEANVDEADILSFWERPSFDLAASTIGVFDGDRMVGYAELVDGVFGAAAVEPALRRRGIGTALAGWMQTVARERGLERIGTHVAQDSAGDRLLTSLGYAEGYRAWDLSLPSRDALVAAEPPAGYTLRDAEPNEFRGCWSVIEDAFSEWSGRERRTLEDWSATATSRPDFAPWKLRVATTPSGEVVATALLHCTGETALIDQLATRADHRRRGLASALITDSVRTAADHGATAWMISTDTRSGARSLYERVGMQVMSTWVHRVIELS